MEKLPTDKTFIGRKIILMNSALEQDYRDTAILLRGYANLMVKNLKFYNIVLPDNDRLNQSVIINLQQSKIKACRKLAERFEQRRRRANSGPRLGIEQLSERTIQRAIRAHKSSKT